MKFAQFQPIALKSTLCDLKTSKCVSFSESALKVVKYETFIPAISKGWKQEDNGLKLFKIPKGTTNSKTGSYFSKIS